MLSAGAGAGGGGGAGVDVGATEDLAEGTPGIGKGNVVGMVIIGVTPVPFGKGLGMEVGKPVGNPGGGFAAEAACEADAAAEPLGSG